MLYFITLFAAEQFISHQVFRGENEIASVIIVLFQPVIKRRNLAITVMKS